MLHLFFLRDANQNVDVARVGGSKDVENDRGIGSLHETIRLLFGEKREMRKKHRKRKKEGETRNALQSGH